METLSPGEALALAKLQSKVLEEPAAKVSVGRYELLQKIGEGGFGEVFLAYDPELRRRVALKVLHEACAAKAERRLVREARTLASMRHPGIVQCFEHGTGDARAPSYVAMEYVEGETVLHWIEHADPSWHEVLDVFLAAGHTLVYAHRHGIVHRDFKPSNVMLAANGEVKVLDFGLVCHIADEVPQDGFTDPLTEPGAVLGTPMYMAPEQHLGQEVGPAADQFAFCAALFHMLYDQPPFAGEGAFRLSVAKQQHRVSEVDPSLAPGWLHAALLQGMRPTPSSRWRSLAALLRNLERRRRPGRTWGVRMLAMALFAGVLAGALALWLR